MAENITEGFPEALLALKHDLRTLVALESQLAAAPVAFKLVDCLTALTKHDFKQALSDVWMCSCGVRKNFYSSISKRHGKTSDRAVAAECAMGDGDYKRASAEYMKANIEIAKGTTFETLFEELNNENRTN